MENTTTAYAQLAAFGQVRTYTQPGREVGWTHIALSVDRPVTLPARPATRRSAGSPAATVMAPHRGMSARIPDDSPIEYVIATIARLAESLADDLGATA